MGNEMADEPDLFIEQLLLGPMENLVYLLGSRSSKETVLIDPAWEIDHLIDILDERELKLSGILLTHYHPDHCGGHFGSHKIPGVNELMEKRPAKVYANKHEADGVKKVTGIEQSDIVKVDSGDKLNIGPIEIEFLHTPGHTPGSQCFKVHNTLVSGDTLFIQGCGRVDLPGSDVDDMYYSLQKLNSLPDDTILLPGHRYSPQGQATLKYTKANNPFLGVPSLENWRMVMAQS